jgi:hypothetical protein
MRYIQIMAGAGLLLAVSLPVRADVKNAWVGVNGAT